MRVVSILTLLSLILAIFGSNNSLSPVYTYAARTNLAANNDFIIQNTSSFIDKSSIMHVYGEIKNISNKSLANVTAVGSFYDSDKKLMNEYQRSCELSTVNPGGICPFEILYLDTATTKGVKDYEISVLGTPIDRSKPIAIRIYPDNSRLDIILGFYYINGRISNEGPLTATDTSLVATLYDKDGRVIALGRALAEPVNIPLGKQASFGIAVTEKSQAQKTKSYSLVAYSDQYLSLPVSIVPK